MLLTAGANPNARDWTGSTPAHYAAKVKSVECITLLERFQGKIGQENLEGETPMHMAAILHSLAREEQDASKNTMECLAKLGLNPNAQTNYGRTPAMNAARYGNLIGLMALCDMDAHFGAKDSDGKTIVQYAESCPNTRRDFGFDWIEQVRALSDRWHLHQQTQMSEHAGKRQSPSL